VTQSHRYGPSKRVSEARFLTELPPSFGSRSVVVHGGRATRERLAQWQAEAEALVRRCLPGLDQIGVESAARKIVGHLRTAWASQHPSARGSQPVRQHLWPCD